MVAQGPALRAALWQEAAMKPARLVVASHNEGKVREIGDLLGPLGIAPISAGSLGLPEPEETETTFAGNAILKARAAAEGAKMLALADDSGLAVEALNGDPGIYSARWAGPTRDFSLAMEKVRRALEEKGGTNKRAKFVCALALIEPGGTPRVFEGEVLGTLVWPPRGTKGFGYDPIFLPDGGAQTFGEMAPEAKHAISHRARAFAKLVEALK
jgi:XTP/dITP diphosphohydrolase